MAFSSIPAVVYPALSAVGSSHPRLRPSLRYTLAPESLPIIAQGQSAQSLRVYKRVACSSTSVLPHTEEHDAGREESRIEELINSIGDELSSFEYVGKMGTESKLEALKLVDLTERLGIQRYFHNHIENIIYSISLSWDMKNGLKDADATVLAFRLLRLHGYAVSAEDIFKTLKGLGEQGFSTSFSTISPSKVLGIINLLRCSQMSFPSESKIMSEAKQFARSRLEAVLLDESSTFLQYNNLRSQIQFALDFSRNDTLPRLESRCIIQQLWPGNDCTQKYLQLAKLDINILQKQYQKELKDLERWWEQQGFGGVECGSRSVAKIFFAIAPTVFEPQYSAYRMAFTKICSHAVILDILTDDKTFNVEELRRFNEATKRWDPTLIVDLPQYNLLLESICTTMQEMAVEAGKVQNRDLLPLYKEIWSRFLDNILEEVEWMNDSYRPTFEEYMEVAHYTFAAEIISWTSIFVMGVRITDEMIRQIGIGSRFTYLIGYITRLFNDMVGIEKELLEGKIDTAIICMQRDNPHLTHVEALSSVRAVVELTSQEIEQELYLSRGNVPECLSRAVLSFARSGSLLYKIDDAFGSDVKEYLQLFNDFFFEPI